MNMNEYQRRASLTAIYPKEKAFEYLAAGLAAEAGGTRRCSLVCI